MGFSIMGRGELLWGPLETTTVGMVGDVVFSLGGKLAVLDPVSCLFNEGRGSPKVVSLFGRGPGCSTEGSFGSIIVFLDSLISGLKSTIDTGSSSGLDTACGSRCSSS